jgi:hypothetical protein
MKKSLSFISLFAFIGLISPALAADTPANTWEVNGGTTGAFNHIFGTSGASAQNQIGILLDAGYFVMPQLEFGFDGSFSYFSTSVSTISSTVLAVGPTYNFSTDILNSFYVKGDIGLEIDDLGGTSSSSSTFTTFYYLVGIGRRVEIVNHIAWNPEVAFSGHTGSTNSIGYHFASQTQLEAIPLQFSFVF